MLETQTLLEFLGLQIEAVIEASQNPKAAMDEIALVAVRRGLIDNQKNLRRESPMVFVKGLWFDNPATLDRLSLKRETLPNPLAVNDLPTVLDLLP